MKKEYIEPYEDIEVCIEGALQWLMSVYDREKCGWGWIQHIPPNEQNTAEVVLALLHGNGDKEKYRSVIEECARNHFMVESAQVTKDWVWVTRALIEIKDENLFEGDPELCRQLDKVIKYGTEKVIELWDEKGGGWPDTYNEPSQVTWTSIVLFFLHQYLPTNKVQSARTYLLRSQNSDGGWGLWKMSAENVETMFNGHPRLISRAISQIESNAACTSLALIALKSVNGPYTCLNRGIAWLVANMMENGGWPIFNQIGIRRNEVYTYRHFSTAWAIRAILAIDANSLFKSYFVDSIIYLVRLRDSATLGWRTSEDSDPFTWATCNAIDALNDVLQCLSKKPVEMFRVIAEWHHERHLVNLTSITMFGRHFIFNRAVALSFALITTALLLLNSITLFNSNGFDVLLWICIVILLIVAGFSWVVYIRAYLH